MKYSFSLLLFKNDFYFLYNKNINKKNIKIIYIKKIKKKKK